MKHRHQTSTLEQNMQFGSDDDMRGGGGEVTVEGMMRAGPCSREQTLSESEVSTRDVEVHNVSES